MVLTTMGTVSHSGGLAGGMFDDDKDSGLLAGSKPKTCKTEYNKAMARQRSNVIAIVACQSGVTGQG